MKFIKFKTEAEAVKHVAEIIVKKIHAKPSLALGLATGSTPIKLYQTLVDDYKHHTISKQATDWSHVKTFNLDEYVGVDYNSEISYHKFMADNLFDKVNINKHNTFFPEDHSFDSLISKQGGVDLQILGIGTNGHIGFNEPGSKADSLTRVVELVPNTIAVNAKKFFNGDINAVPKTAISMGLASILKSKEIILLAFEDAKTDAISKLKKAKSFDPSFPASILTQHPNVTIIFDSSVKVDA